MKKLFVLLLLIAVACSSEDMNKTEETDETEETNKTEETNESEGDCWSNNETEDTDESEGDCWSDDEVSGLIPKENLPKWLSNIVDEFECMYRFDHLATLRIYKGIWCKKVVYIAEDMYSSCLLCEVYDICGNNIAGSEEFRDTWPKDLVLIYEVGTY